MPVPSRFGGPPPGRLLEPEGDFGPRGMIVAPVRETGRENRIRLIGPLELSAPTVLREFAPGARQLD